MLGACGRSGLHLGVGGAQGDCPGAGYGATPVTLRRGGPHCPCTSGLDGIRLACIKVMHPGASLSSGIHASGIHALKLTHVSELDSPM